MDIILKIAIVIAAAVAIGAIVSGVSGASGKEKKPILTIRRITPAGLGEPDTDYFARYNCHIYDLDDGTTQFEYEFDQGHNDVIAAGLFDPDKKALKLESFDDRIQWGITLENRTEPCESRDDAREAFHNYLRGN